MFPVQQSRVSLIPLQRSLIENESNDRPERSLKIFTIESDEKEILFWFPIIS